MHQRHRCFEMPVGFSFVHRLPTFSCVQLQFMVNPFTAYSMIKDLGAPQGGWIIQTAAGAWTSIDAVMLADANDRKQMPVLKEGPVRT